MTRPIRQLEKSLAALTIGVHQDREERADALADGYTGEWEQQIRVPLAGTAGTEWGFSDERVNFEVPFLYAPVQRNVPFATPHFSHSVEMTMTTLSLVIINAHILEWVFTDENWCVGAIVRFAIWAPQAAGVIEGATEFPYSALVHLTFQGYATVAEQEEFQ